MASATGYDIYDKTRDEGDRGLEELLRANADINTTSNYVTPAPPAPLLLR